MQNPDFRITVSMDEYVKSKLRPIEVPKGYLSNTKEISDGMLTNIKGVNGGLGWLASTGRPDMAAPHSIIPSGYDRRLPQLISEVNAVAKQCHAVPSRFGPFPSLSCVGRHLPTQVLTRERATAPSTRMVGMCNQQVLQSHGRKRTRKVGSPQLVETYATSSAVVVMTWIKALWESMTWRDFDILTQRRSSRLRESLMPHVIHLGVPASLP